LRIGILSRSSEIYSTRRIREAAEARGHEVFVADPGRCALTIMSDRRSVSYRGIEMVGFDAVIPRVATSTNSYGSAVVRQFEMAGVYCLNESAAIVRARDKLVCTQLLAGGGIDVPRTAFAHSPRYAEDLVRLVGGPPVVIKVLDGTQGVGVVLADTLRAARSSIEAFWGVDVSVLLQEYIHEAEGSDLRFIVLGDQVVAVMLRQSVGDEFRSNLHRGGTGASVESSVEERSLAVRAAAVLGLRCAGVDIVRSRRGPLVLEVNGSPGLEGVEEASGVDLAASIVGYVEAQVALRAARAQLSCTDVPLT
jgi:ribosomal protein S6--L-glutamate ligase